jgi:hypothetical protein
MLVGRPAGKRKFGRSGRRWKDNTKVDFREIDWISCEPSGPITGGGFLDYLSNY